MKIFPIVFACDSAYLDKTSVALFSMCKYCKTPNVLYKIYYLHNDFSMADKQHLLDIVKLSKNLQVSVEFIKLENFVADNFYLEKDTYITISTYYRLIIPIIFTSYDYVLYVDSDMVFVRDPYELSQINMGTKVIAGVSDRWIEFLVKTKEKPFIKYLKNVLKIKKYQHYINAGVIYFNLKQIRKINGQYEFLKASRTIQQAIFQDQCCINYTANQLGGVFLLPHHFNIKFENELWVAQVTGNNNEAEIKTLIDQDYLGKDLLSNFEQYIKTLPEINLFIHYLSKRKPWNYKQDYVNQVWWGVVYSLPNKQEYIDKYAQGYDDKYQEIYEYISKHYF